MSETETEGAALAGVRVLELGGGVAGAYCAKLFADMGAAVSRVEPVAGDPLVETLLDPGEPATRGLYLDYLNAGKIPRAEVRAAGDFDILILGEAADRPVDLPAPSTAVLDISWFGADGPYADWQGTDLIVQSLAGLVQPVGPIDGPPQFPGEHQATLIAGLSAYCAGVAALIGGRPAVPRSAVPHPAEPRHFEVSILEAILINSDLQICQTALMGAAVPRMGVNRFVPTCPVSIHKCKRGWIGITPLTPAQWQAFCRIIDLPDFATDPELLPQRTRYPHAARMEAAFDTKFPLRTAEEWAAMGREHKVPMVVVPDALGILEHPIFNARNSLARFESEGEAYRVPRTPLRLEKTPSRLVLERPTDEAVLEPLSETGTPDAPLTGIRVADFSMGWAGPLTTRMLADFGAEVIKIEAGRYPDWWRAVEWTPEAIAAKQYEKSLRFSMVNRGKQSVSLDLTNPDGVALAKDLVGHCDMVVENQAAGVMSRLGLGHEHLSEGRDDLIMLSMSAFGAGNAWSDTRAYGSVLEQGSGIPSFAGRPEWPPSMAHIAYGDPIGGIHGAASLLTALLHRRRTGKGQWINNTQIEAMLPFTTPALLIRQATGHEPIRRGNRHPSMVPHGVFPCAGEDRWIAITAIGAEGWRGLARVLGRDDWADDMRLASLEARREIEDEIDAAISAWTADREGAQAAEMLQAAGVAAAPLHHMDDVTEDRHLRARSFFYEIERPHTGHQWQTGLPLRLNGRRYPMRGLAPFLGGDSERVLIGLLGVEDAAYRRLVDDGVVSFAPTQLRGG
jgi:crotonobetainyl-CoA:carnitine CoA-transferase CaiB-like acyl-CoA transferase